MWNALSADIKLSRNVNVFKKMLKDFTFGEFTSLSLKMRTQYLILQFILNFFIIITII